MIEKGRLSGGPVCAWIAALVVGALPSVALAASELQIIGSSGRLYTSVGRYLYGEDGLPLFSERVEDSINDDRANPASGSIGVRISTEQGAPEGVATAAFGLETSSLGITLSSEAFSSAGAFPEWQSDASGACCIPTAGESTSANARVSLRTSFYVEESTAFDLIFGDIERSLPVPGASKARVRLSRHQGELTRFAIGLDRPGEELIFYTETDFARPYDGMNEIKGLLDPGWRYELEVTHANSEGLGIVSEFDLLLVVPEPGTALLVGLGLATLGAMRPRAQR